MLENPLATAIELAKKAHAGQVDKAGQPYVEHPLRVMNVLETREEKIVGVLHDAIEDSDLTLAKLQVLGFSSRCIEAIAAITKQAGEDYQAYCDRVMANEMALKVKIADMTDNMNLDRIAHPTEKDYQRLQKYQTILPQLKAALKKRN
ncbi:GTP pyrophosphokinase [Spirulina sp. 06S082]|uniref:GTP pyrophosphokinase n=1 Tax=Spirulina sp. 06S082 TaxID=3110248 RepID=UPI002B21314E|nr:GTP pyrophosphokinase [Spirulina sp. 06S082]MEA5467579.1 GTP pyrophosphokinase [Spirulina sp. 06S082]